MAIGLARNRLSIPKVNQNPQPPKLAQHMALGSAMRGGTQTVAKNPLAAANQSLAQKTIRLNADALKAASSGST